MESLKRYNKIKTPTEKNFGIVFAIFFFIIFTYFYFFLNKLNLLLIFISVFFLIFSFIYPKIFFYPNKGWNLFGIVIGHIIGQFTMGVLFFFIITPIGYYKSFFNKDFFNTKILKKEKSYWINRSQDINSMKDQY